MFGSAQQSPSHPDTRLNDDMECNVTTMNTDDQMDTLQFLTLVQSRLGQYLGITPEWEDLLTRSVRYGDLQLSTFIQDYLTPHVGVVSFSTDPLVPTMWAHYSRNTGIVVGYDTEALRNLGFALRPMLYSEMAPTYRPASDDTVRLSFFDRERLQEQTRQGETPNSFGVIATANLAEMGAGWRSLSPLLFVKGTSWAYEKEVRLLVNLDNNRDTGERDENCWPVKVIDLPPEAIREIPSRGQYPGCRRRPSCRGSPRGQQTGPLGSTSGGPCVQDSAHRRVKVLISDRPNLPTLGYIRTSRQRIQGTAGSDPEAQAQPPGLDADNGATRHNFREIYQRYGMPQLLERSDDSNYLLRKHLDLREIPTLLEGLRDSQRKPLTYIGCTEDHAVAVVNGTVHDIWDSRLMSDPVPQGNRETRGTLGQSR